MAADIDTSKSFKSSGNHQIVRYCQAFEICSQIYGLFSSFPPEAGIQVLSYDWIPARGSYGHLGRNDGKDRNSLIAIKKSFPAAWRAHRPRNKFVEQLG